MRNSKPHCAGMSQINVLTHHTLWKTFSVVITTFSEDDQKIETPGQSGITNYYYYYTSTYQHLKSFLSGADTLLWKE
jgi:hypothetical protein